ncbi:MULTISPECIES: glycosyltransferase [unclassified Paracoccus (in: a-proteobacteria)]|uniref:glycosyltransferase n=1 Tax=unclassified Paracoccus (in: a-proteobacteria) TaxID=2688777 RepID=UPI0012B3EF27|nr:MULTISPECIES: glycosyltransferase family 2 protein [unclassified Paracoccus (in: a-proteobacteria)]UXU75136.1 glycosyltransferase [Paracoccus sp. SMMA_5]UXU81038.1 glycosyltransferase [Paracoccus sp. SMMA_5_TC]
MSPTTPNPPDHDNAPHFGAQPRAQGCSIILPAHDEAAYIGDCLHHVLAQDYQGALQVIVVANGCRDDTAARARARAGDFAARGWQLQVEELAQGGKIGALNHGDACAVAGIRIYLDADIRMGPRLLSGLHRVLDTDVPRYAGGRLRVTPARSRVSRAYARFWQRLPFVAQGVTGAGLFAVNAAGRARWGAFPAVISDDTFARLQFAESERFLVDEPYDWPLAEGFATLVRVRRRQDNGVAEIARLFPDLPARQGHVRPTRGEVLRLAAADPLGFAAYASVALAVRLGRNRQGWARGR